MNRQIFSVCLLFPSLLFSWIYTRINVEITGEEVAFTTTVADGMDAWQNLELKKPVEIFRLLDERGVIIAEKAKTLEGAISQERLRQWLSVTNLPLLEADKLRRGKTYTLVHMLRPEYATIKKREACIGITPFILTQEGVQIIAQSNLHALENANMVRLLKAADLIKGGVWEHAAELLQQALESEPFNPWAWFNLGKAYEEEGQWADAYYSYHRTADAHYVIGFDRTLAEQARQHRLKLLEDHPDLLFNVKVSDNLHLTLTVKREQVEDGLIVSVTGKRMGEGKAFFALDGNILSKSSGQPFTFHVQRDPNADHDLTVAVHTQDGRLGRIETLLPRDPSLLPLFAGQEEVNTFVFPVMLKSTTAIQRRDLTLMIDGKPTPINTFSNRHEPLHLVVILDRSLSMARHIFEVRYLVSRILPLLKEGETLSFYLLSNRILHFTDGEDLPRLIATLYPTGNTRLADTLHTVYRNESSPRTLIILISDAIDFGSHTAREELFHDASASPASLLFLHPLHRRIVQNEHSLFNLLEKITRMNTAPSLLFSPYEHFVPARHRYVKKRLMEEDIKRIAATMEALRHACEVGFDPQGVAPGSHRITLKLEKGKRSRILHRRLYFKPGFSKYGLLRLENPRHLQSESLTDHLLHR